MIILMTILMAFNCDASILDVRAQNLLDAKDIKDLKIKVHSIDEIRSLMAKCEFELSKTLVPTSCYQLNLDGYKKEVIDETCEKAAHNMKEEVSTKNLSKKCAEYVSKKNKDIRYSREEAHPEEWLQPVVARRAKNGGQRGN